MPRSEHIKASLSGGTARITLDRPTKLNALSFEMITDISALLARLAEDPSVHVVVLDGSGERGFCAGGDIRAVHGFAHADVAARSFWTEEYRLNALIARYPKPLVVLMAGIVMGGGVGISSHASHPVATGTTRLAMPEATIGLIPDVGAMWLLSRAPGELGTYLALTATSIGAADAIAMGLAKYFVPAASLESLTRSLVELSPQGDEAVARVIACFAVPAAPARLEPKRSLLDRAFAHDTVEEILKALRADGSPFALATERQVAAQSPTSLTVTLRALREARNLATVEDCFRLEFRLVSRLVSQPDFFEGVRAALIDKDRNPQWNPANLSAVSPAEVDGYFASLGANELRL